MSIPRMFPSCPATCNDMFSWPRRQTGVHVPRLHSQPQSCRIAATFSFANIFSRVVGQHQELMPEPLDHHAVSDVVPLRLHLAVHVFGIPSHGFHALPGGVWKCKPHFGPFSKGGPFLTPGCPQLAPPRGEWTVDGPNFPGDTITRLPAGLDLHFRLWERRRQKHRWSQS